MLSERGSRKRERAKTRKKGERRLAGSEGVACGHAEPDTLRLLFRVFAILFRAILARVAGYAGDVFRRSRVVVASIATWSLATLLTGAAITAFTLLLPFRRDYVAPGAKDGQ